MERQIWKELPEELQEAVLVRLPMATFFRLRSVCRKWNSLLSSHRFRKQFEELQLSRPWIYAVFLRQPDRALYDLSMNKWHRFTTIHGVPDNFVCPVASAGGLVCLMNVLVKRYYVRNPLTQSFKELPVSGDVPTYVALGMTLNCGLTSGGYKILQVDLHGDYEVYDSIENSWTLGSIPFDVTLNLSHRQWCTKTVSIGDTIYFLSSCPEGIVSYNVETRVWQQETLSWMEIDRMPGKFHEKLSSRMFCFGNKGLVFLYVPSRPIFTLVAYNMVAREWVEVPSCLLPGEREHWMIGSGMAFHPCPTASA